jgi:4-methylaminobutanoate oxidase (formaldehyde-forming)
VAEGRAVRQQAGIVDLSSFGKIAVEGPGALELLQRVSANDIDRPVGSLIYTQWCDERGGIVADVTVTRLADDRFRVVTGAGYLGDDDTFDRALESFAVAYADQNDADYAAFTDAADEQRIAVERGV